MTTAKTFLANDRNGDPVYEGTPLHAKPSKSASRIAIQCPTYSDCIVLASDRWIEEEPIRVHKDLFADTLWTVKPWSV